MQRGGGLKTDKDLNSNGTWWKSNPGHIVVTHECSNSVACTVSDIMSLFSSCILLYSRSNFASHTLQNSPI